MTGKVVLLDTSVIIDAISGSLAAWRVIYRAGEVRVPAIAVGELFEGAEGSRQRAIEIARVEAFIARRVVLPCGTETARQYGQIKHALRLKGRPIPTNDIWIAALAQQHELIVATRDAHFGRWTRYPCSPGSARNASHGQRLVSNSSTGGNDGGVGKRDS